MYNNLLVYHVKIIKLLGIFSELYTFVLIAIVVLDIYWILKNLFLKYLKICRKPLSSCLLMWEEKVRRNFYSLLN